MADRFDYSDAPELVRRFLNYKSGVQNRSKMTVYNYYHDLLTFSRFLLKTKRAEKYQTIANEEIPFPTRMTTCYCTLPTTTFSSLCPLPQAPWRTKPVHAHASFPAFARFINT